MPAESPDKLSIYIDMLTAWNRAFNLTGANSRERLESELIADSFQLARFMGQFPMGEDARIWDLGAGAGLPGIPLRLQMAQGHYILVESREKRALFLANVLARLELPRTEIYRGRVESFFKSQTDKPAQRILSRAFMPWEKLLALCRPHLASDGIMFIMATTQCPRLPSGWKLIAEMGYAPNSKTRFLWALGVS